MILDTNVLIDVMRQDAAAIKIVRELEEKEAAIHVATITIAELFVGVAYNNEEEKRIMSALQRATPLALTTTIARAAGMMHGNSLRQGKPTGLIDSIIAASAIATDETLLTRNSKHFKQTELRVNTY